MFSRLRPAAAYPSSALVFAPSISSTPILWSGEWHRYAFHGARIAGADPSSVLVLWYGVKEANQYKK